MCNVSLLNMKKQKTLQLICHSTYNSTQLYFSPKNRKKDRRTEAKGK